MRLCFVGDSFINGTGDDDALGWPGRVAAAARRGGIDVTYYNLGVRRDTSADIARRWRREVECRLVAGVPARLAFSFGTNDCAPGEAGLPRVSLEATLANAEFILREAALLAPTILIGPAPVLDDPATDERVRRVSVEFRAVTARMGVPYLEIFGFIAGCDVWRKEACRSDGTHPNREGYAALAKHIATWPPFRAWIGLV